jgi:outer membrane protein
MNLRASVWILTSVALAASLRAEDASCKVAVISVQGALSGTKEGQKALQRLEAKAEPQRNELKLRQSEIVSLTDQLEKDKALLSDDKRAALIRDIDNKKKHLERDTQDAEESLQKDQQDLLQTLGQRLMSILTQYAKSKGYSLVVDVGSPNTPVLFASSGIDITQDVITLYDTTYTKGEVTAPKPK